MTNCNFLQQSMCMHTWRTVKRFDQKFFSNASPSLNDHGQNIKIKPGYILDSPCKPAQSAETSQQKELAAGARRVCGISHGEGQESSLLHYTIAWTTINFTNGKGNREGKRKSTTYYSEPLLHAKNDVMVPTGANFSREMLNKYKEQILSINLLD